MTLQELAYEIDKIMCMDAVLDPEVYIQIGGIQAPVNGIGYFPEIDGVMDESVVIGSKKRTEVDIVRGESKVWQNSLTLWLKCIGCIMVTMIVMMDVL